MGKSRQQHSKKGTHKSKGGAKDAEDGGTDRQKGGKQQRRRGKGKHVHWEEDELERELAAVGLRVKTIEADGNCFFRSVCDQLEGDAGDHLALRCRVLDFIAEQEDEYRFFIEDDEPFDKYIKRMKKDGAWAGHLELQATSMLLRRNICVYQAGQPVWHVRNFEEQATEGPDLHLGYHDGVHYNSVRMAGDYGSGPPEPVRLGATPADPAAVAASARSFGAREVEQVVAGTGCLDRDQAARALQCCGGSIEQAIERLIEELGREEEEGGEVAQQAQQQGAAAQPGSSRAAGEQQPEREQAGAAQQAAAVRQGVEQPCGDSVRLELRLRAGDSWSIDALLHVQRQQQEQQEGQPAAAREQSDGEPQAGKRRKGVGRKVKASKEVKAEVPTRRNQPCPCGSKKKYKSCCGARRGGREAAAAGHGAAAESGGDSEAAAAAAAQLQVLLI